MSTGLTLYGIEAALEECQELLESAESAAEKKAAQDALTEYVAQEIEKVDNIRAYLKHCARMADAARDEARLQAKRGEAWEERGERLKDLVKMIMEQRGRKRLEGKTGTIRVQGNGGLKPLTVTDDSLVPDKYKLGCVAMSVANWKKLLGPEGWDKMVSIEGEPMQVTIEILNEAIRAALSRGEAVPGTRLEERGEHLRVI